MRRSRFRFHHPENIPIRRYDLLHPARRSTPPRAAGCANLLSGLSAACAANVTAKHWGTLLSFCFLSRRAVGLVLHWASEQRARKTSLLPRRTVCCVDGLKGFHRREGLTDDLEKKKKEPTDTPLYPDSHLYIQYTIQHLGLRSVPRTNRAPPKDGNLPCLSDYLPSPTFPFNVRHVAPLIRPVHWNHSPTSKQFIPPLCFSRFLMS
ncbi:uncharacterized protein B0T23DRAFT_143499 [Neurospora hispaniola]|uniref:Uncharacterized protein n=1 Tax=Neurospora hispaniola TaxID=588809 RepID=A0AAJ0I887_9PEZI|nr:hypothetical protein B0T23DRAFT_143499 [Neurospora hispaniola]